MLKIEKNIPVQPKRESNNTRVVREMSFGDSVFFPKDKLIYKNQGTRWFPVNVDSFYKLIQKRAKIVRESEKFCQSIQLIYKEIEEEKPNTFKSYFNDQKNIDFFEKAKKILDFLNNSIHTNLYFMII